MKTLILGGVKSGKSRYAESLASCSYNPVCFIATAQAHDTEMLTRIERHKAGRDSQWQVIEEPLRLAKALSQADSNQCVIVDCLTLWMSNLLMLENDHFLAEQQQALLEAAANMSNRLIFVSNETNMGVMPLGELTRRYCDEMGLLHQQLAAQCDSVVLMVAGLCHPLKMPDS